MNVHKVMQTVEEKSSIRVAGSIGFRSGSRMLFILWFVLTGCATDVKKSDVTELASDEVSTTSSLLISDVARNAKLSGHDRMVAELRRIAGQAKIRNPYVGTGRKKSLMEDALRLDPTQPMQQAMLLNGLGVENLKLGDNRSALEQFREADQMLSRFLLVASGRQRQQAEQLRYFVKYHQVLGWLRIAEQTNCVECDDSESCLYPISAAGVHQDKKAAKEAVKLLDELLAIRPSNLRARWLRELLGKLAGETGAGEQGDAKQGSGEFTAVSQQVVVNLPTDDCSDASPNEATRFKHAEKANAEKANTEKANTETPDRPIPRLKNVAGAKHLNSLDLSGGMAVEDYNGDGWLDVVQSTSDPTESMKIFFSDGKGGFVDQTKQANLQSMLGGLNLNHADYDNDGDLDLYVMRGAWWGKEGEHPNSLLRNDGHGHFEDVTFEVGLGDAYPSLVSAWSDYDNDGDLDLFVGADESYQSRLYRNDQGKFVDVSASAGLTLTSNVRGATWGDFDNDGYPDLYISNLGAQNLLLRNNQDGTFSDQAFELGVAYPRDSFACWFWDYNNDGQLDLFVASYSGSIENVAAEKFGKSSRFESPKLYRGNRGTFEDVTAEMGLEKVVLAMGANYGDLDGDGFEDIYLGTGDPQFDTLIPNLFFHNQLGKRFADQTAERGLGHLQKGHGISFADFDEDGDADLFVQLGGAYKADRFRNALFENPGHQTNWLKIRLRGEQSNASGIGARIKLRILEGKSCRTLYRQVSSGGSFGANPFRSEIGLGRADKIESLEVTWPASGARQVFKDLSVNQSVVVDEKAGLQRDGL